MTRGCLLTSFILTICVGYGSADYGSHRDDTKATLPHRRLSGKGGKGTNPPTPAPSCIPENNFEFIEAISYSSLQDGDAVASDFLKTYNLFSGCDGLDRVLEGFEVLESVYSQDGEVITLNMIDGETERISSDFVIKFTGACNCGSETLGFGTDDNIRMLQGRRGNRRGLSSSSSPSVCPCLDGTDTVSPDVVVKQMANRPNSIVEVVDRSEDCQSLNSFPVFQETVHVNLGGSGPDRQLTQKEIDIAAQGLLSGLNMASSEGCSAFRFQATSAFVELMPDDQQSQRRDLSGSDRNLQLPFPFQLFSIVWFGSCLGACRRETTVFGGNPGSRRLEGETLSRDEFIEIMEDRQLNQAVISGCYCPVGSSQGSPNSGIDIQRARAASEASLAGSTVTIQSDFDEEGACASLVENTDECGAIVKPGKEELFCFACLGNIDDFEDACCRSLVETSCDAETKDTRIDILDDFLFCSTCADSSIVTGPILEKYIDTCCTGDDIDLDRCCGEGLVTSLAPDACNCGDPNSEYPICNFCSRQLEVRNAQWMFRRDADVHAFCSECGPMENPPGFGNYYNGANGPSRADYMRLCHTTCFSEETLLYQEVPDCCHAMDLSHVPSHVVHEACCSGLPWHSQPGSCAHRHPWYRWSS